jgi:hypothetical protein
MINFFKKIIYRLLKKFPFHIYIYSYRLNQFVIVNPKLEPHDFRQIFWPDFKNLNNLELDILIFVGASAGINILNLISTNRFEKLITYEVNEANNKSLSFNLKDKNADIRMYGISLKGGGAIFSPVSSLSGSLTLNESGIDNSFSFNTISVYEFLNSHTSGNCTLVLNCNGFERPIIESLIIRKIKFKYLIVYFFDHITGYDKKLILSEISSAYEFVNIDGPYYIFKINNNLI